MTSPPPSILTAVRKALACSTTRAEAAAVLVRALPDRVTRAALMSLLRDDAALGVTITRRWPAGV